MNIGEAAKASGVSAKMIRHYEAIGLIPPPPRSDAGYRVYGEQEIHTLRFIRRARDLGFSIKHISRLLALWQDRSRASADVKRLALSHVEELERKARDLQEMAATLKHLARNCHGDSRPDVRSSSPWQVRHNLRRNPSFGRGVSSKSNCLIPKREAVG